MTDQFEILNAGGDGLGHRPVVGFYQLSAWNWAWIPHVRESLCAGLNYVIWRSFKHYLMSHTLNPAIPQKVHGVLMDPPMSVPNPSRLPPIEMRAPSPPEEPPGTRVESRGWQVWPESVNDWTMKQTGGNGHCAPKYSRSQKNIKAMRILNCILLQVWITSNIV